MPDLPCGSSAEPLRYQTICVTTGARRSGMTTTVRPLSSRKSTTPPCGGARGRRLGDVETGLGGGKRHRDPGRQETRTAGGGPFSSGNRHIGCNLRRRQ